MPEPERPLVLVPGACLGGWAWRDVARDLRGRGHDVYPMTLTGLGDRVHLATPEVDLETHITDVVNLLGSVASPLPILLVAYGGGTHTVNGTQAELKYTPIGTWTFM